MSVASAGNYSSAGSSNTEDFWNQKKQSLQSLKQGIRNGKRNLLVRRFVPPGNRNATRQQQRTPAAAAAPAAASGRSRSLSSIPEPQAISSNNYRNYLRTRFPHVAAAAAAAEVVAVDDAAQSQTPVPARRRSRQQQQQQQEQPSTNRGQNEQDDANLLEAYIYFCENRRFAHDFVTAFIEQHLDEDEIPDILIDSVNEAAGTRQPQQQQQQQQQHRTVRWQSRAAAGSAPGMQQQLQQLQQHQRPSHSAGSSAAASSQDPLAPQPDDSDAVADILRRVGRRPLKMQQKPQRRLAPLTPSTPPTPPNFESREAASVDAMQLMLRDVLPQLLHEIAADAVAEEAGGVVAKIGIADIIAPHLLNEAIADLLYELCSESVKELAMQEVAKGFHYDVFLELVDELVQEYGPAIARRAVGEDFLENLLDEIVDPVVDDMLLGIATDVLTDFDSQIRRRDMKELQRTAKEKPLDSLVMQLLIDKAAEGDSVLITSATLHKFLDATEMDILLKQREQEQDARKFTTDCVPLRLIQQRVFADTAAAVVTDELLQQIDADLADLDFDEVSGDEQARYITNIADIYNTDDVQD